MIRAARNGEVCNSVVTDPEVEDVSRVIHADIMLV